MLKPAAEAVGLVAAGQDGQPAAWVSFHTFRHTCVSLLFDAGRNVRTYVHLIDEGLGDADFLDAAVAQVNAGSTHGPQTAANDHGRESALSAL